MAKRMNQPANAGRKAVSRPKTGKAAAAGDAFDDDDAGGDDNLAEFDPDKFKEHVTNVRNLKSKGAEIRGKIGAAVKNAEEDYGIHRGASSLWIKLEGMTDEARDAFLQAFDDMRIALGRAHQGELFTDSTPAAAATFAGRT